MSESDTLVENTIIKEHKLNDTWILYAHLPHDTDWTLNSYKEILKINTAEQIIAICENLPESMIQNCMLFLMRHHIKPIWEDDNNKNGGCISYKILENDLVKVFKLFCYHIICNILSDIPENHLKINGISISPKKSFSIIKIWLCDETIINDDTINNNTDIFNIDTLFNIDKHICIYKKHTLLY